MSVALPAKGLQKAAQAVVLAGLLAVAGSAAMVKHIDDVEGKRNYTYEDIIKVPTYCYGQTGPAAGKVGTYHSDAECNTTLAKTLRVQAYQMAPCLQVVMPEPTTRSQMSFAYNVGVANWCGSRTVRFLNALDLGAACTAMNTGPTGKPAWVFAGGVFSQGVANRRAKERALCELGLQ